MHGTSAGLKFGHYKVVLCMCFCVCFFVFNDVFFFFFFMCGFFVCLCEDPCLHV